MRLINTSTLRLEEFFGDGIPPYAILSHRWGKEEVDFEMFTFSLAKAKKLHGFKKIENCAKQARKDGLQWCWVDTCCIDKRSSSELSEAINSMFQWYESAVVCYAFLEDVLEGLQIRSVWFERGWTLQELIAPKELRFYNAHWNDLGTKSKKAAEISSMYGIEEGVLLGEVSVQRVNVGQRMRWASNRKTTRVEDIAYCLLGIFDVNMPLLYGEGRKAFTRLQEEIIRRSDDHTIFSWIDRSASRATFRSLLARSPAEFKHSKNVESVPELAGTPFTITNRGLHISLALLPVDNDGFEYLASLSCRFVHSRKGVAVRLRRTMMGSNQFARVDPYRLFESTGTHPMTELYVPENLSMTFAAGGRFAGFMLNNTVELYEIQAIYNQEEFQEVRDIVRFRRRKAESVYIVRLSLKTNGPHRRDLVVALAYNPHLYPTVMPAGSLGVNACTMNFGSCVGAIGTPSPEYEISKTPLPGDIDWSPMEFFTLSVNFEKLIVEDEVWIGAIFHEAGPRERSSTSLPPLSNNYSS